MTPTCRSIQLAVCKRYGITLDEMLAHRGARHCDRPRQIAMAVARRCTGQSLLALGKAFKRDHTTVLHGVRAAERLRPLEVETIAARMLGDFPPSLPQSADRPQQQALGAVLYFTLGNFGRRRV